MASEPRKVTLVADELLGYTRTGGLGTATTFLALALGRMGHRVQLLYASDPPKAALGAAWARLYEGAGVEIRILPREAAVAEPPYFARMRDVELALAADPPDVVITQDLAAPAYTAMRMRQLGLAFDRTLFVVYCHGTRQWITDAARKVGVLPGAIGIGLLEQASVELADVVVSPSHYLVDWMRQQRWRLPPSTRVIPHLTRAVATGEARPRRKATGERVEKLAFFGRLEERKGIRPFLEALNALPSGLLAGVDVDFVGRPTATWTPERIRALLSETVNVSFATDLDQPEALERLARPGTLAVIPSFAETFGYTVRECLDYGIPFIASTAAAIQALIAPVDRARVLFEPTAAGIERALRQALADGGALRPARAAFDTAESLEGWSEVVETRADPRAPAAAQLPVVDVLRRRSLDGTSAPFVVFLEEDDEADADLVDTLKRAQAASDADVVSCGLRVHNGTKSTLYFFHGEPGGLGLLFNGYGTVALLRRSLIDDLTTSWPAEHDPDWPLLANLSLSGARIVSVPTPLVTRRRTPGSLERHPSDALLVIHRFERALPEALRLLARLAAGLAAARNAPRATRQHAGRSLVRRLFRRSA